MTKRFLLAATAPLALGACATIPESEIDRTADTIADAVVDAIDGDEDEQNEQLAALFAAYDEAQLEMSPISKSYRGIIDEDYGKWDDVSDAAEVRAERLQQDYAARLQRDFDLADLDGQDALSYRLFLAGAERSASLFPFRDNGYIFNQMFGAQSQGPAFLINIHRVATVDHAEAYISRIGETGRALDTLIAESRERAANGVMPPKFVYAYVIDDIENLLGAGDNNAILEDFAGKVDNLDIAATQKASLRADALAAWRDHARPSYERLLAEMKRQQAIAGTDDGVWRFADGAAYYDALLASYTTTDLTADQIHNIGLREVARIHGEMRDIMDQVGFEGSLQDFFEFTRTDDRFFYDTREEYLADAQAAIDRLMPKLPEYFGVLPEAPFVIKPVEAFREKSAGKAFYQRPAPDGSRPGTYYVNLYNLQDMSKNELEALAYHEAIPGHHLQLAIQTELDSLPAFRRFGGFTAYSEGWGLYSEELGKDMGFYTDPYSDFGRLGMELWRAARLVVDTGIHSKRWSREQAIAYLSENTPNPDGDIRKAIERYIVMPGQATAYMIGKLKIMELRERARTELGSAFDIRGFHDVVLTNGPVPLSILEENVEAWIAAEKR